MTPEEHATHILLTLDGRADANDTAFVTGVIRQARADAFEEAANICRRRSENKTEHGNITAGIEAKKCAEIIATRTLKEQQ